MEEVLSINISIEQKDVDSYYKYTKLTDDNGLCSICNEIMTKSNIFIHQCQCIFHRKCIYNKTYCPNCTKSIDILKIDDNFRQIVYKDINNFELPKKIAQMCLAHVEKIAVQGDGEAQYYLGMIYKNGTCVKKHNPTSLYWFQISILNEYYDSYFEVYAFYKDGYEGFEPRIDIADKLLLEGVEKNDANCCHILGLKYHDEKNYIEAYKYFMKALKINNEHCPALYQIYKYNYLDIGIPVNKKYAIFCLKMLANKYEYLPAIYDLALHYDSGLIMDKDTLQSIKYLKLAIQKGRKDANYNLALIYLCEETKDYKKAYQHAKISANNNHDKSIYLLGTFYEHGIGIKKNLNNAFRYYFQASELGNIEALFKMGICYEFGNGIEQNDDKAIEYYKKASDLGHKDAKISCEYYTALKNLF